MAVLTIWNRCHNDWYRLGQTRARFPPRGLELRVQLLCRQPVGREVTVFPILWVFAKIPAATVIPVLSEQTIVEFLRTQQLKAR